MPKSHTMPMNKGMYEDEKKKCNFGDSNPTIFQFLEAIVNHLQRVSCLTFLGVAALKRSFRFLK